MFDSDIQSIIADQQRVCAESDLAAYRYAQSGDWSAENYLSPKTAIVHKTGMTRQTVNTSLSQGELLHRYPIIMDAIRTASITCDHIKYFVPLLSEKYYEYFNDDVELLVANAKTVAAEQFCHVVRHWKNMVDALGDEPTPEYEQFLNRKLFLNELMDGTWLIHGELDCITGKILDKALKDIMEKLWRSHATETRCDYSPAQQRADAIGYLAQGYVTASVSAESPAESPAENSNTHSPVLTYNPISALSADVVIDLNDLNSEITTRDFLDKCLTSPSPIINTHSPAIIDQILCDSHVHAPVNMRNGTYEMGRSVRTAPIAMKRQMILNQKTCSIPGCITPSRWCDAHHLVHWADGGPTDMDNLALLCRRHHSMLHLDKTFAQKVEDLLHEKSPPYKYRRTG